MKPLVLILSILLITGCSFMAPSPAPATEASLPTATLAPTITTPTPPSIPTQTVSPTATQTLEPSATVPPTLAAPVYLKINEQNSSQVVKQGSIENPVSRTVIFSPDSHLLAGSSGNEDNFAVRIWQAGDAQPVRTFDQYSGIVWDIAFSPDGQRIASAANDNDHLGVRVWQLSDGQLLQSKSQPDTANSIAYSPDGKILAVGGLAGWPNGVVYLYDTTSWKPLQVFKAPGQNVIALNFSPDGKKLLAGGTDGKIREWQVSDGALLKTFFYATQLKDMALSPDGQILAATYCNKTDASGCIKGGVVLWNMGDGSILHTFDDIAESLAFSPDGTLLVTGSGAHDPVIRIRDMKGWTLLNTLNSPAYTLAFSPDGKLIASADMQTIMLWGIKE